MQQKRSGNLLVDTRKGEIGEKTLIPLPEDAVFIGSRLCPRPEVVQGAISHLKEDIGTDKQATGSLSEPPFHNRFTLYAVWTFAFATGVRAIITPYIDPFEVSGLNNTGLLRDKDSDSGAKAKLVWIPKTVKSQMDHYSRYIGDSPKSPCSRGEPCYFLNNVGKHLLVRPASLGPEMAKYLPGFPVGIHRRFMFNALLDSGCPPETVRVWMGHALTGDEPWSRHASFSYAKHRTELSRYLLPILEYLGFEPISGERE